MEDIYVRIPLTKLVAIPPDGVYSHYVGYYWIIDIENNALIYRGYSAQCNKHKQIVEGMLRLHPEGTQCIFLESAWLPYDTSEYIENK